MDWEVLEPKLMTHKQECLDALARQGISEREADVLRGELLMVARIKGWNDKPIQAVPRRY